MRELVGLWFDGAFYFFVEKYLIKLFKFNEAFKTDLTVIFSIFFKPLPHQTPTQTAHAIQYFLNFQSNFLSSHSKLTNSTMLHQPLWQFLEPMP
jgi:hypothetical protein